MFLPNGRAASFRFLWGGQIAANLGDVIYIVSVIKLAFSLTGSVTFMTFVPFTITFAGLISGFAAPLIINKYNLKSILFYSQLSKTVLLLLLTIGSIYEWTVLLPVVFLLIAMISLLDGFASPARNALIPFLVPDEKLVRTNSLVSISDQITQLIAWPIGSILLVAWGETAILWLTFLLYIVSTLCMGLIQRVPGKSTDEYQPPIEAIKEGWKVIWQSPQLRTISFMNVLESLGNGVWVAAILLIYVNEVLNKGEQWWGFINGAFFAGMFLGGLVIYRFSNKLEAHLGRSISWAAGIIMCLTFWFGMTSSPLAALVICLLFGFPQMARDVAETTVFQRSAETSLLAKVYSARGTLIYASFGISSIMMGWVAEHFGVRSSYMLSTGLFLVSFIVSIKNKAYLEGGIGKFVTREREG
ncbi:MFS transporter [Bacillus sp. B-jedd]|uniref:MFS transporter n=1 Tax=Bacillus sp. B-jedd TaxID=1476857 RepID=UPI00051563DD|nr:MFS transporter [Bacillus sp. B-jedd]CEG27302.1 major facilitator superfamily protein [Bacillus sp. B-jedd]